MAVRRRAYTQRYWKGIFDSVSSLDPKVFTREGFLTDCANYHVNRGLLKRQGTKPLVSTAFGSSVTLQGGAMYRWGSTKHLVVQGGGALKRLNGSSWTAITGALTLGSAEAARLRTAHFTDASNNMLLGCNGDSNNPPWQWTGSGNASAFSGSGAPTYASDVCQFRGHVLCLNVDSGAASTQYSAYGLVNSWPSDHIFDATRESEGVNLAPMSQEVCLIMHRKSVHRLTFNYGIGVTSNIFQLQPVDLTVGSWARAGCVVVNGACYFIGGKEYPNGIYRISDPTRRAKYISLPVQELFNSLNKNRIEQAVAVVRGMPWNEIAWLFTSDTSTTHDIQIVYNYEYDTWTRFDSPHSDYKYASACMWNDSSGDNHTLLLGYDGYVYDAWGDVDNVDTGNLDHDLAGTGGYIETLFTTGYLDLGYQGQKQLRELWYDVLTDNQVNFDVNVRTAAALVTPTRALTAGQGVDVLGSGFILGTSRLGSQEVQQAKRKVLRDGRFMRLRSVENGTGNPHRVLATHWLYKPGGMTLN